MSRIDEALKRAAGRTEAPKDALSEFGAVAVAELTFTEPVAEVLDPPLDAMAPEAEVERAVLDMPPEGPHVVDLFPAADPVAEEAYAAPAAASEEIEASSDEAAAAAVPDTPVLAPAIKAGADGSAGDGRQAAHGNGNGNGSGSLGPGALFHGFPAGVSEKLVVGEDAGRASASAVAIEQYRRLAAALHHAQVEREMRVVMITSAIASEGKTLTATNLALTLSESYRRNVLLIDADLRRPGLHQMFHLPNTSGLHDGLSDGGDGRLSLLEITPHLMLLPAGRPDSDPMSMLTSSRMRRVIEEASARFDWVIVDAPPVGLITDASLLAKMVDATLIVIQAGKTDYPIVRRAVDAIGRERIFGVVLNRMALPESPYGYKYDRYYAAYRTHPDGQALEKRS